jgi:hypothetical protein
MKRPAEWTSAQFADLLRLSQQFSQEEARSTVARWQSEAGDTAEVSRFVHWLIARGYLTESQANELIRDHTVAPGPPAAPAVPVAAAPPPGRWPESSTSHLMKAVIVAPAANPHVHAASAPAPGIDVELVDAIVTSPLSRAAPFLDAETFADLATPPLPPAPDIDDEVVAPVLQSAPLDQSPARVKGTTGPPLDWTNLWLHLFLGALGLLAAECAGWILAQVVARIF